MKVALTLEERRAVERAACHYLLFAEAESRAPTVTVAREALENIASTSAKLSRLLSFSDPYDAIRRDALGQLGSMFLAASWRRADKLAEIPNLPPNIDLPVAMPKLWRQLLALNEMCIEVRAELEAQEISRGSYRPRAAFGSFVRDLAAIYTARGLKPTAAKSSEGKKKKGAESPFVDFARAIYKSLPALNTAPRPSGDTAFAEAVATAISKGARGVKERSTG